MKSDTMTINSPHAETIAVHTGEHELRVDGAINVPIFQSSTYELLEAKPYHEVKYLRLNNSRNHELLHKKLAALEGAPAAVVTSSGMSAISTTFLTLLQSGDHFLSQQSLYGGTNDFIRDDLPKLGITNTKIDIDRPDTWKSALQVKTKMIYVEAISNPLLQVPMLTQVVEFAKQNDLLTVIDNTFTSPFNYRPFEDGFDLSVHSATKYLNGHSDLVAGCVIGREDLVEKVLLKLNHLGGCLDTHTCFLFNRGLKTMALRVQRQNENALYLARYLGTHPEVERVLYPGLPSHPHHQRAREFFTGYGGMLCFELKGDTPRTDRFLRQLKIPMIAPSLGGVESLVTRPVMSSHSGLSAEERRQSGLSDKLVRYSVGIEHIDDLIYDFKNAFEALG